MHNQDSQMEPAAEPFTVLLAVPDNLTVRMVSSWLHGQGYSVVGVAARGEDALIAATASRPGLVILDASLPCPGGPVRTALEIRDGLGVPVLVVASDPHSITPITREAGLLPQEVLQKPFGPENLVTAIEAAIACRRAVRQHPAWNEAFRRAADTMPGIVMVLDTNRCIRYINVPGAALAGCPRNTLAGLDAIGTVLPSTNRDSVDLRRCFGKEQEFRFIAECAFHNRYHISIRWTCEPARDGSGRCAGWICLGTEESEKGGLALCLQKEVLQQLEDNVVQLATLNDRIRNPLQVIAAFAEFVDDDIRDKILLQVEVINGVIRQLDQGTLESLAVREFLLKHCKTTLP